MKRLFVATLLAACAFALAQADTTLSTPVPGTWSLTRAGAAVQSGVTSEKACLAAASADAESRKASAGYACGYSETVQATYTTPAPAIALSGLPAAMTAATGAKIGYTAPTTVYCRLDNYAPIVCPNPFTLGATAAQALSAGSHSVDFYAYTAGGAVPTASSTPIAHYIWVVSPPATTTPPVVTTPPISTNPGATPLPSAFAAGTDYSLEAPSDAETTSVQYNAKGFTNGLSIPPLTNLSSVTRAGVQRIGPAVVDGLPVIRHVVYKGDPLRHDGNRAELSYDSAPIWHGTDYWMSFAIKLDSDWTVANSGGHGDNQDLMQTHQEETSPNWNSGGPFGFIWKGDTKGQEIQVTTVGATDWSGSGTYTGPGYGITRFVVAANPGGWQRYIVHYRSGITKAQAPLLEIWVANAGGAYSKLTDLAPGTVFGDPAQASTHDWPKIGIYKWTSTAYGSTAKRGMYSSGLYFAKGASLFDQAAAAIASFAR